MEQFQIGDVVYLKSGSPAMTIIEFKSNGQYKTVWIDGNGEHFSLYPPAAITKDDPNKVTQSTIRR